MKIGGVTKVHQLPYVKKVEMRILHLFTSYLHLVVIKWNIKGVNRFNYSNAVGTGRMEVRVLCEQPKGSRGILGFNR